MMKAEFLVCGADFGGPALGAWPTSKAGRLVPHKGGGGGTDAAVIEQQRQQRAKEAIDAINNIFDNANREALYQGQRDAVYNLNAQEVERQAREPERANRFALARNGLLGGSVDIDSNTELNRRTNEGLSKAGGIADAAMSDLQAADENTRNNLVSMATAGTDATTAGQLAASGLRQNMDAARSNASVATVGNLFNDIANAYLYQNLGKYVQGISSSKVPYATNQTTSKIAPQNEYGGSVY